MILIQNQHIELEVFAKVVRRISIIVIVCLLIQSTCLILYFALYDSGRENARKGGFNIILFLADVFNIAAFVQVTSIVWYLNSVSVGPIVAEAWCPSLCSLFKWWDAMNLKLIPNYISESSIDLSSYASQNTKGE